MAGPYPPHRQAGDDSQLPPQQPSYPPPYRERSPYGEKSVPLPSPSVSSFYPGSLPPPVDFVSYPRRRRALWLSLLALGVISIVLIAVLTIRIERPSPVITGFTDAVATTAIQNYLDALSTGDTDVIARNSLCGMYDGVQDQRSDQSLARLASDAFREQFTRADVASIDKIVPWSTYQAQVLFTMRVTTPPTTRTATTEEQAVAQLLRYDNQILVCSFILRTTSQY